jgi:hypothetical protein
LAPTIRMISRLVFHLLAWWAVHWRMLYLQYQELCRC